LCRGTMRRRNRRPAGVEVAIQLNAAWSRVFLIEPGNLRLSHLGEPVAREPSALRLKVVAGRMEIPESQRLRDVSHLRCSA
jgi:hypothetical protein